MARHSLHTSAEETNIMDTLRSMRIFTLVAQAGSFSAVARSLNLTTGAVSRAVSELEERLKVRLLHRTSRRVTLTPQGEIYARSALRILADVADAEGEARGTHETPEGVLRVALNEAVGQEWVMLAVSEYRKLYPNVAVQLKPYVQPPDLFSGIADVALISASSLADSDLVCRVLGATRNILCASPAYLREHRAPRELRGLKSHAGLVADVPGLPSYDWFFDRTQDAGALHINGKLIVTSVDSLICAMRQGMGIGMVPAIAVAGALRDGSLLRVLPAHTGGGMNIYALYPSRRFVDAKIRTWIEFLQQFVARLNAAVDDLFGDIAQCAAGEGQSDSLNAA